MSDTNQETTPRKMKTTSNISSLLKRRDELFNPVLKIMNYMKIGEETCSHLEILNDILNKNENERSVMDNKILSSTSTIIFSIFRYLNDKRFARTKFLGLYFDQMVQRIFEEYDYFKDNTDREKNVSKTIINRMNSMESSDKDIMDLLISLFFFRKNLSKDNRIGDKPFDHLFFTAMIHFSFELFENRIPNNKDIFEVCLALSILSNDRKNFTLNNVNRELKAIHSNLKIEIRRGSPLGFYDNKCYPLPQIQTDRRVERVENNSTTTTNSTVVEVKKVSEPVSNGIISNNTVEENKKDNTTTNNTNEVVQQQSIKSSRMKKKN